jgi:hypothetical protein
MTSGMPQHARAPSCAARSPLRRAAARTGIAGMVTAGAATVAAGAMALLLAGCGGGEESAIQGRLRAKGTAEVMREAAAARYVPPADGRLTGEQVRMYLEVREREIRIREAAGALRHQQRQDRPEGGTTGDRLERQDGRDGRDGRNGRDGRGRGAAAPAVRDDGLAAADLRAAQELRANPKEYAWVRARVQEAETAAATQALFQKMAAGREQLLARMRRDRDALSDPERRAAAERQIEDYKRGLQGTEPQTTPAVRANVALLARYREPLARLRTLETRALASAAGLEPPAADAATGAGH